MKIATRYDLEIMLADAATHDGALEYLQALMDERYQFNAGNAWGIVEPTGLTRLGLTVAEAVALGAVDRVMEEPAGPDLSAVKTSAILTIDAEAERRRGLIVTPGVGQMQEYRLTAEEATRAQAAADPLDAADYPYLEAERRAKEAVGVAWTLRDTAAFVLAEEAAWTAYGAAIKEVRRTAKERVVTAETVAAVQEIVGGVAWPGFPGR